jgi:hypothetical protein
MRSAIVGVDLLTPRLVENRVGSFCGAHLCQGSERLQVDDTDLRFGAVAAEALAELMGYGKSVHAGSVRDIACDGVGIQVHDDDVGAVGHVKPARLGIDR